MENAQKFRGVFAAAVTPLKPDLSPDLDGLNALIHFLAQRGCHGILLMGTTGEGPSFSVQERQQVYQAASSARIDYPSLQLLAGTGTPSLEETIYLTSSVFDLGYDGVVVLPPYYFRKAADEGLFAWFSQVIQRSVPADGALFGYHIPPVSGVSFGLDLLARLKDTFPYQFKGIKDSSGDPDWARSLGNRFGSDLVVLNGNDRLLSLALGSNASGCITAMANLLSPVLRTVWDNYQSGVDDTFSQELLTQSRELLDRYPPMPPLIKMLLSRQYDFPRWSVKPPLVSFDPTLEDEVLSDYLSVIEEFITS